MIGSDLLARLRAMSDGQHDDHTIGDEAADEIEELIDDLKRVRAAERARCIAVIRRLHDLLPEGERRRSRPGLIDAIIAIELLDQSINAHETEDTP